MAVAAAAVAVFAPMITAATAFGAVVQNSAAVAASGVGAGGSMIERVRVEGIDHFLVPPTSCSYYNYESTDTSRTWHCEAVAPADTPSVRITLPPDPTGGGFATQVKTANHPVGYIVLTLTVAVNSLAVRRCNLGSTAPATAAPLRRTRAAVSNCATPIS